jgi:sulfite reductase alpha subunit-like flavoprotein
MECLRRRLARIDRVPQAQLVRASIVIFVVSTTGQGDLPANATLFWRRLLSKRLQPGCLRAMQFTSFGLGDSSYLQYAAPESSNPRHPADTEVDLIGLAASFTTV